MIAAVILAGGKSERMGTPKALLRLGNKTFLEHIIGVAQAGGISEAVVVVGHHRDAILQALALPRVVYNARYEQGMSTSVQEGIRALPAHVTAALVILVDHPAVSADTVRTLAAHAAPDRIVLPVYKGRRGHPVAFGSGLFREILDLDSSQGLNTIVRRDSTRVTEVEVADPGVLVDIDTPEQFKKWLSDTGQSWV